MRKEKVEKIILLAPNSSFLVSSGTRMCLIIDLHQTVQIDVGVFLRGRETRVTQQFLDSTQVRPGVKEMRGKGMAQRVRAGFESDSTISRVLSDETRHAPGGKPLSVRVEKDRQRRRRRRRGQGVPSFRND